MSYTYDAVYMNFEFSQAWFFTLVYKPTALTEEK